MADQPPTSNIAVFFASVWGRILAILTAIALLLGIAAEGLSLYRNYQEAISAAAEAERDTLQLAAFKKSGDELGAEAARKEYQQQQLLASTPAYQRQELVRLERNCNRDRAHECISSAMEAAGITIENSTFSSDPRQKERVAIVAKCNQKDKAYDECFNAALTNLPDQNVPYTDRQVEPIRAKCSAAG
jgi:hypothetical protein